jgi:regulatory protein
VRPKKPKTRTNSRSEGFSGEYPGSRPARVEKKSPPQQSLRARALRLLSRREFSRQELASRLRPYAQAVAHTGARTGTSPDADADGGVPANAVIDESDALAILDTLLDDLAERGWLSDARYAEAVVRKRSGQYARRSIAQELKCAGVDADVAEAALAQNLTDPQADPEAAAGAEFEAALALCQRKFRKAPVEQKDKARQVRFLQSRGYSLGLALRVIKHSGAGTDFVEE